MAEAALEDRMKLWPDNHCVCDRKEAGPHATIRVRGDGSHTLASVTCKVCGSTWKRMTYGVSHG